MASKQILLTPERYLEWVREKKDLLFHIYFSLFFQISIVDHDRAKIIIQWATKHYSDDFLLWNKRLSLLIDESIDSEAIKKDFKLACQNSNVKVNYYLYSNSQFLC